MAEFDFWTFGHLKQKYLVFYRKNNTSKVTYKRGIKVLKNIMSKGLWQRTSEGLKTQTSDKQTNGKSKWEPYLKLQIW